MVVLRFLILQVVRVAALLSSLITVQGALGAGSWSIASPTGRLEVNVEAREGIWYSIKCGGEPVITPSPIDVKVEGVSWLGRQAGEIIESCFGNER